MHVGPVIPAGPAVNRPSFLPLLLPQIQCSLQDIGSALATPRSSAREAHLSNSLNPLCVSTGLYGGLGLRRGGRGTLLNVT